MWAQSETGKSRPPSALAADLPENRSIVAEIPQGQVSRSGRIPVKEESAVNPAEREMPCSK